MKSCSQHDGALTQPSQAQPGTTQFLSLVLLVFNNERPTKQNHGRAFFKGQLTFHKNTVVNRSLECKTEQCVGVELSFYDDEIDRETFGLQSQGILGNPVGLALVR